MHMSGLYFVLLWRKIQFLAGSVTSKFNDKKTARQQATTLIEATNLNLANLMAIFSSNSLFDPLCKHALRPFLKHNIVRRSAAMVTVEKHYASAYL